MDAISESRFYMWRALFAVAHADNFLALEEQGLLANHLDEVPFSKEQLATLREDMATPQSIEEMFRRIGAQADRDEFFALARELVWIDGNLDEREKELVERLGRLRDGPEKACAEDKGFFSGLICKLTGRKGKAA